MRSVAVIDPLGSSGSTRLLHGLGWAFTTLGKRVLLLDLDPHARLTAACLDEEQLEDSWHGAGERRSVFGAIRPALEETGEVGPLEPESLSARLGLLVGDVRLGACEGALTRAWRGCSDASPVAFRAVTACQRVGQEAGRLWEADLLLVATGSGFGALDRAALLAAEQFVVVTNADLFAVEALAGLGAVLDGWRHGWEELVAVSPHAVRPLPSGAMAPVGYVIMQPSLFGDDEVRSYDRWLKRIPAEMAKHVLGGDASATSVVDDPARLGIMKRRLDLETLARAAHKPMFQLTHADGAVGSLANAAHEARRELKLLARQLASAIGLELEPGDAEGGG
jgi:chromosome partitioning protein